jgi:hypothetical protein
MMEAAATHCEGWQCFATRSKKGRADCGGLDCSLLSACPATPRAERFSLPPLPPLPAHGVVTQSPRASPAPQAKRRRHSSWAWHGASAHAAYVAKLPGKIRNDVGVVIHHTDAWIHAPPTAYVAYDAVVGTDPHAAARHFDVNGQEFRLP